MTRWRCGAAILAIVLAACSARAPRQTKLMQKTDLTISAAQLQVQVRSLAGRFSGLMEQAGTEVLRQTDDPEIRRGALQWLTNGIPAMQTALFAPDPLAALLDGWFLVAQMHFYFEDPEGNDIPQQYADIALRALDIMEADIRSIVTRAGSEASYQEGRQLVYDAARNTTISGSFVSRQGSAIVLSEFTARAASGTLKSIGALTETVDDIIARFDLYAEYLPKQARWQAQLLLLEEGLDGVGSAISNLEYLEMVAADVARLTPLAESLPELVTEERLAVLEALDTQLTRILRFVEQQRVTVMHEDLRAERQAILDALRDERIAVLAAAASERQIILETLHEERLATFEDLDALIEDSVGREIDRLFVRALILIAVLLGGLALLTFVGVRAVRKRSD
ncbi:MAG: hypothetical protein P8Y93_12475 [Acidobacteriota bacterium]